MTAGRYELKRVVERWGGSAELAAVAGYQVRPDDASSISEHHIDCCELSHASVLLERDAARAPLLSRHHAHRCGVPAVRSGGSMWPSAQQRRGSAASRWT